MEQNDNVEQITTSGLSNWQRIEMVVKMSGMSVNAFARCIGLARGENLYQIKKGNNGISRDLAKRITDYYPQISFSWLMTGEGAMTINGKSERGIPFYKCSCVEDLFRIETNEPDGYVAMPEFEDCCAVIAHNWGGRDGIPKGSYVFLHRVDNRYVRKGQYFLVTDHLVRVCEIKMDLKEYCLKLSGPTLPSALRRIKRDDAKRLYLIRGVLNVVGK